MFRCPLDDDRPCAPVRVFARGAAICGRHLLSPPPHPGTPTTARCDTTRRRDGKAASWASSGGSTAGGWHGQLHTWVVQTPRVYSMAGMPLFAHAVREKYPPPPLPVPSKLLKFCGSKTQKLLFKVFRRSTGLVFAALFCSSRQAKKREESRCFVRFFCAFACVIWVLDFRGKQ